jgi:hypothetical protein
VVFVPWVFGVVDGALAGYHCQNAIKRKKKMSLSKHRVIRETLHNEPDGMTVFEISSLTGIKKDTIRNALEDMPDTYIDRWVKQPMSPPEAVWIAVVPPLDCPKP